MASISDKKIVLSNQDAERIKEAEKRLKTLETKDVPKPSPALIPLGSSSTSEEFPNLSFKITDVKSLSKSSVPQIGRPKKIRYKTLPNGQQIKIVPKSRQSLVNSPSSPATRRLPSRNSPNHSLQSGGVSHRTSSRFPPNRVSLGGIPNRNTPNRVMPTRSLPNRILPSPSIPRRTSLNEILPDKKLTINSEIKRLSLPPRPSVNPISSVASIPSQSIPTKLPPKLDLPLKEDVANPACSGTTKITRKEKIISISPTPSQTLESTNVASSNVASSKRKSQHVTKPISEITFEESVEVDRNENTELMEYVACLRVALNNLLQEVELSHLEMPGAVGKIKIYEKIEEMMKEKNQGTDDENEREQNDSMTSKQDEIEIKTEN